MGSLPRFLLLAALMVAAPALAQEYRTLEPVRRPAQGRIALVIGNADYALDSADLRNPHHDAEDVTAVLHRLGFTVITGTDLSYADMDEAVRSFAIQARGAEVALIFFAGHGIELDGENYLVPVDAVVESPADLRRSGIPASWVLERAREEASLAVLILDACRNNPFRRSGFGSPNRSFGSGGLAQMDPPRGTIVAFAAASGEVASDNQEGRNGLFTAALLTEIETPDVDFVTMLRRVRRRVFLDSQEAQFPTVRDMSIGTFVLNPSVVLQPVPVDPTGPGPVGPQEQPPPAPSQTAEPVGLTQERAHQFNADVSRAQGFVASGAYGDALPLLEAAAEQGHAEAQSALGWLLLHGHGVPADTARAVEHLRSAAEQRHPAAMTNLGYLYEQGAGVATNLTEAARLYAEAADPGQDVPDAIRGVALNNLGSLVQNGRGVLQDSVRAFDLIHQAAQLGVPIAKANLGYLHEHGIGTPRNEFHARQNYYMAGQHEIPWALYRLGMLYLNVNDASEARVHLGRAAEFGHADAQRALGDLAAQTN